MKKLAYLIGLAFLLAGTNAEAQTVKEKTEKTWNKKKKGAVIGGLVGAGTGVLVSKKNAKGAVIGGAVGAGAGYLYGRQKEKKNPTPKTKYKRVVKY